MGLFSKKTIDYEIELYKQRAHLSNEYLQNLTPLIESANENEGRRHEISNQLIQLVNDMKENLPEDRFIKAVAFVDTFVKYSENATANYNRLIQYYKKMGEKTKILIDEYGAKANVG